MRRLNLAILLWFFPFYLDYTHHNSHLSENVSVKELYLADNADTNPAATLPYDSTSHDMSTSPYKKLKPVQPSAQEGLEVADSEDDDEHPKGPAVSCQDGICPSSSRRHLPGVSQAIEEMSTAIACAVQLQLLDLSGNAFTKKAVEVLYSAWRGPPSGLRPGGPVSKHVKDQIVHFSVEGRRCCGVKACCRRDG